MKILLDTHALLWALENNPSLSSRAAEAIADPGNDILVSAASIMEIATKHRIGKMPEAARIVADWGATFDDIAATSLAISVGHAALAGRLDIPHKDPFDRFLIAQALIERVPLVTNETLFDGFGVERLW